MRDERDELLARLPKHSMGAEIGVHKGEFSKRILDAVDPIRLHLVDPWTSRPQPGAVYNVKQNIMDARYNGVLRRFENDNRVRVWRMTSEQAARLLPPLDWVYIDGDHSEAGKDIELWWNRVRPGGLICGDDYGHDGGWWGDAVTRAVNQYDAEVFGSQFIIRRDERCAKCNRVTADARGGDCRSECENCGYPYPHGDCSD